METAQTTFSTAVVMYLERHLHNSAKVLNKMLTAETEVPDGFCLPDNVQKSTGQRVDYSSLEEMKFNTKSMSIVITLMFDKWLNRVLSDLTAFMNGAVERQFALANYKNNLTFEKSLIKKLTDTQKGLTGSHDSFWKARQGELMHEITQLHDRLYAVDNEREALRLEVAELKKRAAAMNPTPTKAPELSSTFTICVVHLQYEGWYKHPSYNKTMLSLFADGVHSLSRDCNGSHFELCHTDAAIVVLFSEPMPCFSFCLQVCDFVDNQSYAFLPNGVQKPRPRFGIHHTAAIKLETCIISGRQVAGGCDVHIAMRLCGIARGGEVLLTCAARNQYERMPNHLDGAGVKHRCSVTLRHPQLQLRNIPVQQSIWQLTDKRASRNGRTFQPNSDFETRQLCILFDKWLLYLDHVVGWKYNPLPLQDACIVKMRVDEFEKLRQEVTPNALDDGLHVLRDTIRQCTLQYNGYEIYNIYNEQHLIELVFATCKDGVNAAMEVQERLLKVHWPKEVADIPIAFWATNNTERHQMDAVWRGLRLKVGVAFGRLSYVVKSIENPPDPTLVQERMHLQVSCQTSDRAYSLCEMSFGGEIIITYGVYALSFLASPPVDGQVRRVGDDETITNTSRKVYSAETLFSIVPHPLRLRVFSHVFLERVQSKMSMSSDDLLDRKKLSAPAGSAVIVSVCIQYASFIQSVDTIAFDHALEVYERLVKGIAASASGMEVSYLRHAGGAFTLLFASPTQATRFALLLHEEGLCADWGNEILRYKESGIEKFGDAFIYRGLRLKVGAHFGHVSKYSSTVARGEKELHYFYGSSLGASLRACELCPTGGVLLTHSVYKHLYHQLSELGDPVIVEGPLLESDFTDVGRPEATFIMFPRSLELRHKFKTDETEQFALWVRSMKHEGEEVRVNEIYFNLLRKYFSDREKKLIKLEMSKSTASDSRTRRQLESKTFAEIDNFVINIKRDEGAKPEEVILQYLNQIQKVNVNFEQATSDMHEIQDEVAKVKPEGEHASEKEPSLDREGSLVVLKDRGDDEEVSAKRGSGNRAYSTAATVGSERSRMPPIDVTPSERIEAVKKEVTISLSPPSTFPKNNPGNASPDAIYNRRRSSVQPMSPLSTDIALAALYKTHSTGSLSDVSEVGEKGSFRLDLRPPGEERGPGIGPPRDTDPLGERVTPPARGAPPVGTPPTFPESRSGSDQKANYRLKKKKGMSVTDLPMMDTGVEFDLLRSSEDLLRDMNGYRKKTRLEEETEEKERRYLEDHRVTDLNTKLLEMENQQSRLKLEIAALLRAEAAEKTACTTPPPASPQPSITPPLGRPTNNEKQKSDVPYHPRLADEELAALQARKGHAGKPPAAAPPRPAATNNEERIRQAKAEIKQLLHAQMAMVKEVKQEEVKLRAEYALAAPGPRDAARAHTPELLPMKDYSSIEQEARDLLQALQDGDASGDTSGDVSNGLSGADTSAVQNSTGRTDSPIVDEFALPSRVGRHKTESETGPSRLLVVRAGEPPPQTRCVAVQTTAQRSTSPMDRSDFSIDLRAGGRKGRSDSRGSNRPWRESVSVNHDGPFMERGKAGTPPTFNPTDLRRIKRDLIQKLDYLQTSIDHNDTILLHDTLEGAKELIAAMPSGVELPKRSTPIKRHSNRSAEISDVATDDFDSIAVDSGTEVPLLPEPSLLLSTKCIAAFSNLFDRYLALPTADATPIKMLTQTQQAGYKITDAQFELAWMSVVRDVWGGSLEVVSGVKNDASNSHVAQLLSIVKLADGKAAQVAVTPNQSLMYTVIANLCKMFLSVRGYQQKLLTLIAAQRRAAKDDDVASPAGSPKWGPLGSPLPSQPASPAAGPEMDGATSPTAAPSEAQGAGDVQPPAALGPWGHEIGNGPGNYHEGIERKRRHFEGVSYAPHPYYKPHSEAMNTVLETAQLPPHLLDLMHPVPEERFARRSISPPLRPKSGTGGGVPPRPSSAQSREEKAKVSKRSFNKVKLIQEVSSLCKANIDNRSTAYESPAPIGRALRHREAQCNADRSVYNVLAGPN